MARNEPFVSSVGCLSIDQSTPVPSSRADARTHGPALHLAAAMRSAARTSSGRPLPHGDSPPIPYPPCASTSSTTTCRPSGSPRRRGRAGRAACSSLDRGRGAVEHRRFAELPELLRAGDLLVRNDVACGPRGSTAGTRRGASSRSFCCGGAIRTGAAGSRSRSPAGARSRARRIAFDEGLAAEVLEVGDDGTRTVALRSAARRGAARAASAALPCRPTSAARPGAPDRPEDRAAYQTVFAREPLAVARADGRPPLHGGDPRRRSAPAASRSPT